MSPEHRAAERATPTPSPSAGPTERGPSRGPLSGGSGRPQAGPRSVSTSALERKGATCARTARRQAERRSLGRCAAPPICLGWPPTRALTRRMGHSGLPGRAGEELVEALVHLGGAGGNSEIPRTHQRRCGHAIGDTRLPHPSTRAAPPRRHILWQAPPSLRAVGAIKSRERPGVWFVHPAPRRPAPLRTRLAVSPARARAGDSPAPWRSCCCRRFGVRLGSGTPGQAGGVSWRGPDWSRRRRRSGGGVDDGRTRPLATSCTSRTSSRPRCQSRAKWSSSTSTPGSPSLWSPGSRPMPPRATSWSSRRCAFPPPGTSCGTSCRSLGFHLQSLHSSAPATTPQGRCGAPWGPLLAWLRHRLRRPLTARPLRRQSAPTANGRGVAPGEARTAGFRSGSSNHGPS